MPWADFTVSELIAWFTWRDLLRLAVLSVGLTLACGVLFQRNAPSRRALLVLSTLALILMPILFGWLNPLIPVGVSEPQILGLEHAIPGWVLLLVGSLSIVGLAPLTLQLYRTRQAIGLLAPSQDSALHDLAQPVARSLGLRRCPEFLVMHPNQTIPGGVSAPFASSLLGGVVVLPADFSNYDTATQRAVIVHELVHLARHDDRWYWVIRAMVNCYWFLPWLRSFKRRYLLAMEHSCDDRAADFFGRRCHYMNGVVDVARGPGPDISASTNAGCSGSAATQVAKSKQAKTVHPLVQRVLRFGQRREFDADATVVTGYLSLTVLVSLTLSSLVPIAKPVASNGKIAAAGFHLPLRSVPMDHRLPVESNSVLFAKLQPTIDIGAPVLVVLHDRFSTPSQLAARPAPQPMSQPQPIYPGTALRHDLEGDVWVEYSVAQDGSVVNARIIHSSPARIFDRSALRSLRYTRFPSTAQAERSNPTFTRTGGDAMTLRVRQRFRYQLHGVSP